jgi:hypothetical protein
MFSRLSARGGLRRLCRRRDTDGEVPGNARRSFPERTSTWFGGLREDTLGTLVALGADVGWLHVAWTTTPIVDLPAQVRSIVKDEDWPAAEAERIYAVMQSVGEPNGWSPEQIESVALFVMDRSFGRATIDQPVFVERIFEEDAVRYTPKGPLPPNGSQENFAQVERLLLHLERPDGTLPAVRDLTPQDVASFHSIPPRARIWVTREVRKKLGDAKAEYVQRVFSKPLSAMDFARILLTGSEGALDAYRGWRGMLKLADLLGISKLVRVHDIARYVLPPDRFKGLGWISLPTYFETWMLTDMHQALASGNGPRSGDYRGGMGLADFADAFTRGDAALAYQVAAFVLTADALAALEWPAPRSKSSANQIRFEAMRATSPELFEGPEGVIRAAIVLDASVTTARSAMHAGRSKPQGYLPALTAAELDVALRALSPAGAAPHPEYAGNEGLEQLALDYFGGDKRRAFTTYQAVVEVAAFKQLGWSLANGDGASPAARPFRGAVVPPRLLGLTVRDRLPLSSRQRWVAKRYLMNWVDTRVHAPSPPWTDAFSSANEAIRAIQQVGEEHGFAVDWLGVPLPEPPTELVRKMLQNAAVTRYLQWHVDHPKATLSGPVWAPGVGHGVVAANQVFGEGPYAGAERDYRIFDNRAQAMEAIEKRARELRIALP